MIKINWLIQLCIKFGLSFFCKSIFFYLKKIELRMNSCTLKFTFEILESLCTQLIYCSFHRVWHKDCTFSKGPLVIEMWLPLQSKPPCDICTITSSYSIKFWAASTQTWTLFTIFAFHFRFHIQSWSSLVSQQGDLLHCAAFADCKGHLPLCSLSKPLMELLLFLVYSYLLVSGSNY